MPDSPLLPIEQTPGTCGGKPRIAGTRIKVSLIATLSERNRLTPDEIVEAYPHLTLAQVHAALAYYWEHRDEIEQEIRDEQSFVDKLEAQLSEPPLPSSSPV
ncbi:MAG: DUF433 domain-containing protein [Pirellulales bacterium]